MRKMIIGIVAVFAVSLATASTSIADESTPLSDDRIAPQTISAVGDAAELPLVLYEDVTFNFAGICPSEMCTFTFEAKDGLLALTGVEAAAKASYLVFINIKWIRADTPAEFHQELRAAVIRNPSSLVPSAGS